MSDQIDPFYLDVPEAQLADLRERLAKTRWPERETVEDTSQGPPLAKVQALCKYWLEQYDWRRCETMLNGFGQFRTTIDGLGIHFLHVRSPEPGALPLVMTHGWPGSVLEFHKVIGALTDPGAHGGNPKDAFHLVIPSLPGFGFSDKPTASGWGIPRIAKAWITLMERLGYKRWGAQGGDWGGGITGAIGRMASWIYAMFQDITDSGGNPETVLSLDTMLDDIMLYWLPNTGASSARLYWEAMKSRASGPSPAGQVQVPAGFSMFPKEVIRTSRRWMERRFSNIVHFNELDKGGHFAALEQPDLFVNEVRESFRSIR